MTPDEIDQLQRLVPSDSDAAHVLWKARQEAEVERETTYCCQECADHDAEEARQALITTFDRDWATAPLSITTGNDRTMAAYFWFKGRTAGRTEGLMQSNVDLREMMRAAKERL